MINQHPDFIHSNDAPIGVFDSGVGGLSVYLHLKAALPNERFIYYADTLNVPYGDKSGDEILLLTLQAVARLCKQGCKLIVVACNSASAYALTTLRERCSVPIVGLVPAVKPACMMSQTKQIAVLATKATLSGALLDGVIREAALPNGVTVHKHFEPLLVPWVEGGMPKDSYVAAALMAQMLRWADDGVDVVVLGCTHYPFFRGFVERELAAAGRHLRLIDSGEAVALRVQSLLRLFEIASHKPTGAPLTLYASRQDVALHQTISALIGDDVRFVGADFLPLDIAPLD